MHGSLEAENLSCLESEADVTMEEWLERHSVAGFEEGAMSQGCVCGLSKAEEAMQQILPSSPQKGAQSCWHLDFNLMILV